MEENLQDLAGSDAVSVHAGFPNPATDNLGRSGFALDLNQLLIRHPSSTFLFRIRGGSWADQGIFDNDIAVIDRASEPYAAALVLSWQEDQFELHRYATSDHRPWGIVTAIIHTYQKH